MSEEEQRGRGAQGEAERRLIESETALAESEQRLRLATEATGIGIFDWYPQTGELTCDARYKEMFGLPPDTKVEYELVIGRLHPEDRAATQAVVQRALDPSGSGEYQTEYRTVTPRSGQERWVAATGRVFFDEERRPARFVGTVLDITAKKRAERDRARVLQELREALEVRDEFLILASHELRTPLTTVRLQTDALLRLLAPEADDTLAGRVRERIERMGTQVDRLERLIDDLLDVTRLSGSKLDLRIEEVDLAQLARIVTARMRHEMERAGCPFTLRADSPVWGRWDRAHLDRVITKLLSNAIKYGAGKPIEVSVQGATPGATLGATTGATGDEMARLVVRDEGIGIPIAKQGRIFERFERAVDSKHFSGFGLALWLTRKIVEAHGGTITFTSEPGAGATFTVELPPHTP